ncbi:hypothetical protein CSV71_10295 [Sporosarcina sp. P21c]|uniref:hypothetical protein n=1 Tax=Sporosarcina TaxID=1569 RepID=UPI000A15E276|nr:MULTISPECIES: hypothetical protein [Sporosarcina]ARJ39391.1 hypothetical protein SporoP8_11205 [Sporosarcina ureae]PIC67648.1 hypothetical protein CSV78_07020 [Sporosarcina sp. P16a]PIC89306.1 hypothetical protein CSV71_10295 [Sporosarcina sp. P21c]PIC93099.1 hypothetical protein CSV70_07770 [Sporosarcina sp. P25]
MKQFLQLVSIGIVSGAVLALLLFGVWVVTGNEAYVLLYNVDYFPIIHVFSDVAWFGIVFHFVFCIASVLGLFYLLKFFKWQYNMWPYVVVYTAGSGVLYFLTLLTDRPPAADDGMAWLYWTGSHLIYGVLVASLVIRYVDRGRV